MGHFPLFLEKMKNRIIILGIAVFMFFIFVIFGYSSQCRYKQYYLDHIIQGEHGLRADYYDNPDLKTAPVLSRVEERAYFKNIQEMNLGRLEKRFLEGDFSIRWHGLLTIPSSGMYKLKLFSDDGSWLSLSGVPIIKNGGIHPLKEVSVRKYIREGVYPIEIRYFQAGGESAIGLYWRTPKSFRSLSGEIPSDFFQPVDSGFNRAVAYKLLMHARRWSVLVKISILILVFCIINLWTGFLGRYYFRTIYWVRENSIAVFILLLGIISKSLFLGSVPGIQGDETWSTLTALSFLEGEKVNIFRGMSPYSSPFWLFQIPLYILFGFNPISLRMYPVIFNTLALLFCYLLVKKAYNKRIALFSLFILSIWPIAFMFSRISFDLTTFNLFFLFLSLYLIYSKRTMSLLIAGFAIGAGAYNHLIFICVPISLFVLVVLETKGKIIFDKRLYLALVPILLFLGIRFFDIKHSGLGIMHNPLSYVEIIYIIKYSFKGVLLQILDGTIMFKLFTGRLLLKVLPINLIVLIGCFIAIFIKRDLLDRNLFRLIFITVICYIITFATVPTVRPRYFLIPVTLMGLFASICLGKIADRQRGMMGFFAKAITAVLLISNIFYLSVNYFYSYQSTRGMGMYVYHEKLSFPVFVRSHKYICIKELYDFLVREGYNRVFTNYWIWNNLSFWDIENNLLYCSKEENLKGGPHECLIFYETREHVNPGWHSEWRSYPGEVDFEDLQNIKTVKNFDIYVK